MSEATITQPGMPQQKIQKQQYGINGTLMQALQGTDRFGKPQSVLIIGRGPDKPVLPVNLYADKHEAFVAKNFQAGDPIRVYGTFGGQFTLMTEKYGPLQTQAFTADWVGRPDPNRAQGGQQGDDANGASGQQAGGETSGWEPPPQELDEEVPF